MPIATSKDLEKLAHLLDGDLHYDDLMRTIYATDASVYSSLPLAVALPKNSKDIQQLIHFATTFESSLIPRTAGTSLAGQCVGNGIVVDTSRYMNQIIEFNKEEGWVKVQPGVIRNELNAFLKPYGCFFSPITATANRAMIGGMVGNNSCGFNSIVYGATRDHVLELEVVLSDGSTTVFNTLSKEAFAKKCQLDNLEGQLYQGIYDELSQSKVRKHIQSDFPKTSIQRRNTGYAVDYLLKTAIFEENASDFNFCKLLSGSEGTLAITTAIKLHLDPLPPPVDLVIAVHFDHIHSSMLGAQAAMKHPVFACELMDKIILDCTKGHPAHSKNRFFIEGDPKAVLLIECRGQNQGEAEAIAHQIIDDFKEKKLGYAFPIIHSDKTNSVWALRSSGLGLLANIPGDKKAVACIEDTAVAIDDLADYIQEFTEIMDDFKQESVYYAHAGAGELHLRPILDLKKEADIEAFFQISKASAELVKKYNGSLSGEHGDGRLRAPFIPLVVGQENYDLFKRIKDKWDPLHIFNPGKIIDAAPMNTSLRYQSGQETPDFDTILDFSSAGGMLRMAEKCNGSGDCRKLPLSGGTLCPSYQASRDEKNTTRARANTLRRFLTQNTAPNPFDHKEIREVLDLCLSCKACISECPSNVDMASLKAEFLHQYYTTNGVPLRAWFFANNNEMNQLGSIFPGLTNLILSSKWTSNLLKKSLQIAPKRSLPLLPKQSLRKWYKKQDFTRNQARQKVYIFCDAFTNYHDAKIGIKAVQLLERLGYNVQIVDHPESGRAAISKGLLKKARAKAAQNVGIFAKLITEETPLIGVEPSALLSFRDEYPRLLAGENRKKALFIAKNALLIGEFITQEFEKGNIRKEQFHSEPKKVLLHGHCHQKALASIAPTVWALSIPKNYSVEVIPSGCCGMAGSFGYEKEHYEMSMQVGELVLFPAIRKADEQTILAASGTSCRQQILDGTKKKALHPVEILFDALE